jgi:hypothetical protein
MTITTTIRCDACGKEERWPEDVSFGREKTGWQELLHDGQWRHVCSTACVLKWLELIRTEMGIGQGTPR